MTRMDYHIHTTFSDGEADYKTVIDLAIAKGLDRIAITDHFDPSDHQLSNQNATAEELVNHFSCIRAYAKNKKIKVLCGIETCTPFDGKLIITDQVQAMCDIIITSPHYVEYDGDLKQGDYSNDDYWNAYKRKVLNMATGDGDILGHPEGYLPMKPMLIPNTTTFESRLNLCRKISQQYFDREYIDALGERLACSGKAYELHGASMTPREWVVKRLHEIGVAFSIGSDAHAMNILGKTQWAEGMVQKYKLKLIDK